MIRRIKSGRIVHEFQCPNLKHLFVLDQGKLGYIVGMYRRVFIYVLVSDRSGSREFGRVSTCDYETNRWQTFPTLKEAQAKWPKNAEYYAWLATKDPRVFTEPLKNEYWSCYMGAQVFNINIQELKKQLKK